MVAFAYKSMPDISLLEHEAILCYNFCVLFQRKRNMEKYNVL